MQNTQGDTSPQYRERLTPSLWIFVAAALVGPMAALVLAPLDASLGLVAGALVGLALVGLLIAASPTVSVQDGWLFAGRARIDTRFLGATQTHIGEDARLARGPGLDTRSWHLIRGGIDGIVVVALNDPDDPVASWTISTRTPDRLAAAIQRAELQRDGATRRTPDRSVRPASSPHDPAESGA